MEEKKKTDRDGGGLVNEHSVNSVMVCVYVCMYVCTYVCRYVCVFLCVCACVYVYVYVCVIVRACVRVCVHHGDGLIIDHRPLGWLCLLALLSMGNLVHASLNADHNLNAERGKGRVLAIVNPPVFFICFCLAATSSRCSVSC